MLQSCFMHCSRIGTLGTKTLNDNHGVLSVKTLFLKIVLIEMESNISKIKSQTLPIFYLLSNFLKITSIIFFFLEFNHFPKEINFFCVGGLVVFHQNVISVRVILSATKYQRRFYGLLTFWVRSKCHFQTGEFQLSKIIYFNLGYKLWMKFFLLGENVLGQFCWKGELYSSPIFISMKLFRITSS